LIPRPRGPSGKRQVEFSQSKAIADETYIEQTNIEANARTQNASMDGDHRASSLLRAYKSIDENPLEFLFPKVDERWEELPVCVR
jgi:hypothetical protein